MMITAFRHNVLVWHQPFHPEVGVGESPFRTLRAVLARRLERRHPRSSEHQSSYRCFVTSSAGYAVWPEARVGFAVPRVAGFVLPGAAAARAFLGGPGGGRLPTSRHSGLVPGAG